MRQLSQSDHLQKSGFNGEQASEVNEARQTSCNREEGGCSCSRMPSRRRLDWTNLDYRSHTFLSCRLTIQFPAGAHHHHIMCPSNANAAVSFNNNNVDIEEAAPAVDGQELSRSEKAWDIDGDGSKRRSVLQSCLIVGALLF